MRVDGIFIAIEVDDRAAGEPDLARRLTEACPVDIFAEADGGDGVQIVERNVDECVLCRLCLDASPPGVVKVIKLYDNDALLA
jgi:NAD-dependent dihydropyrimidine dehydrogenase PreA subunit